MSLTGFDDIRWQVEEIEEFASYWRQLPKLKGVPLRSDFNPAEVSHILPNITIYEFDLEVRKENGPLLQQDL